MIDNDLDTVYEGTVKAEERTEDAQAVISLEEQKPLQA